MMIESFTGMMTCDDSRCAGRVPAVALDRPAVSLRAGAPSVGLERFRSLPRARALPGLRAAVPDDGGTVGLRVLPCDVLLAVRRSSVDTAAGASGAQRADAGPAVRARAAMDRPPHRRHRRAAARRVVVQYRLRVHAVVRRRLHGALSDRYSDLRHRPGARTDGMVRAHRPRCRRDVAIQTEPDSDSRRARRLCGLEAAGAALGRTWRRAALRGRSGADTLDRQELQAHRHAAA